MSGQSVIEMARVPPSLNRIGTRGNHFAVNRAKRSLQDELVWLLHEAHVPKHLTHVRASATLTFPSRRRRDPGNFSWLLEKSLGDALAHGPHARLPDDTAPYFEFISPVAIEAESGQTRTRIVLDWQ